MGPPGDRQIFPSSPVAAREGVDELRSPALQNFTHEIRGGRLCGLNGLEGMGGDRLGCGWRAAGLDCPLRVSLWARCAGVRKDCMFPHFGHIDRSSKRLSPARRSPLVCHTAAQCTACTTVHHAHATVPCPKCGAQNSSDGKPEARPGPLRNLHFPPKIDAILAKSIDFTAQRAYSKSLGCR